MSIGAAHRPLVALESNVPMLMVISPAKTLEMSGRSSSRVTTEPRFQARAATLVERMQQLSPPQLAELMGISDELADLNFGRYLSWEKEPSNELTRQAIMAFRGDVYLGLEADSLKAADLKFAQKHLRILSGLYGVLRPLDSMQAYRLEMGTKIDNPGGRNLYEFWGDSVTQALQEDLVAVKAATLVNLASNEYFKSVKPRKLPVPVVTPVFKDRKGDTYKVISFYAKRARGAMVRWAIDHRVTGAEELQQCDALGYRFQPNLSDQKQWVFTRDSAE